MREKIFHQFICHDGLVKMFLSHRRFGLLKVSPHGRLTERPCRNCKESRIAEEISRKEESVYELNEKKTGNK
jgi:hypothetical protein